MSVMASAPLARWALPAGVVVAVAAAGVAGNALRASADVTLPERSAAQLLVDLETADLTGASGTVVEQADLGLPALPEGLGGTDSYQLSSLVTGSHTLRVWYSGPDQARVALLGTLGESDIIRTGTDIWTWYSADNTATHTRITQNPADRPRPDPTVLPTSPQEAAQRVLAALDPSTSVTTEPSDTVAGRGAYELVLAPRDTTSLVGKVRVALDGAKHVPTRVQVYAKGAAKPAFEIAFKQVSFARPDSGVFRFSPPPGVKVTENTPDAAAPDRAAPPKTAVIGTGWTSVFAARGTAGTLLPGSAGTPGPDRGTGRPDAMQAFLDTLSRVQGTWGSGRLLQSTLFSVLLTDDGRILAGAVSGARLQQAAADPAAALR